jgi:hypothetical protein
LAGCYPRRREEAFRRRIGYLVFVPISLQAMNAPPPEGVDWNEAAWPVVRIMLEDGKDDRFIWLLRQFEGLFARRQRYLFLMDTTTLTTIPAGPMRHIIGKWQNEHEEETKTWCVGATICISSRLVRGALTAMNWVHEPVLKQHYPTTRREALDWCIATADEAGLTLSSATRDILQSRKG